MKRWALVTVALYALMLLVLTLPLLWIGGAKWAQGSGLEWEWGLDEAGEVVANWGYWLWLGILLAAQALLLVVPVTLTERRPRPQRHLWVPTATASFLLANLLFAGVMSLLAALKGDHMDEPFEWTWKFAQEVQTQIPLVETFTSALGLGEQSFYLASLFGSLFVFWLAWGLVFYHFARGDAPEAASRRAVRWLLRGSMLELLIAVPCHVAVRCRNTCCAQAATFWGIVTGLSVMLMAFGPGVFFLFAERARRLRPRADPSDPPVIL